ncbi:MAG: class I SAM-dependent methyltransferase [Candidatus Taylorbacteria bacterium]
MKKIKLVTSYPNWPLARQTPDEKGIWGNCQFLIDDNTKDCDWCVVSDSLKKDEIIYCDPKHTILITAEPPSIKTYNKKFVRQFHTVITSQTKINAPKIIHFPLLPWYIGAHFNLNEKRFDTYTKNYSELSNARSPEKSKLISIITSNKNRTIGHRARLRFLERIQRHFGNRLDVFGSRINTISDKWDGIAPYKYHIVIENSSCKDYFSEKLSDAFLAEAYPLYFGCPNIFDYFPKDSLTVIDINDPNQAIKTIEQTIENNCFEKFRKQVIESKELCLNKYQIFPKLCQIINESVDDSLSKGKEQITLKPEAFFIEPSVTHKIKKRIKTLMKWALKNSGYDLVKIPINPYVNDPDFEIYKKIADVPGFLSFEAFKLFSCLKQISLEDSSNVKQFGILEIGVYCGMSLLGLGLIYKDKKIVGVDPFFESFDETSFNAETEFLRHKSNNLSGAERYNRLQEKGNILGIGNRIDVKKMTQKDFLEKIKPCKYQMIYVDGEHTYQSIVSFLERIDELLPYDGFLVLDDFLNAGFPGLSEAIHLHPSYKKSLFPVCYAFNKAVFLYKPKEKYLEEVKNKIDDFVAKNVFKSHRSDRDNSVVIN